MTWRSRLLPASYRGAPFQVASHDSTIAGRRTAVHENPGRDEPYAEDLGRATSQLNLAAYVVGRDYDRARGRLIAACAAPGEGELIHPYLGTYQAICTACSVSERSSEGGIARFELQFVTAVPPRYPERAADVVDEAGARTAASAALVDAWPARIAGWPLDAVAAAIRSAASQLGPAGAPLAAASPRDPGRLAAVVAAAASALSPEAARTLARDGIGVAIAALARTPARRTLAQSVVALDTAVRVQSGITALAALDAPMSDRRAAAAAIGRAAAGSCRGLRSCR